MAINTAKKRMLEGKPAFGAEVNLGSYLSAELLSPLGFDFILVDNQHGAWDDVLGRQVAEGDEIMLVTDVGKLIRMRVDDIRKIGRNTQGVRLMDTGEDERVVSVTRLAGDED